MKVAIVTGANSGIGLAVAKYLCRRSYIVYDLSRHPGLRSSIVHIDTDVTVESDVQNSVQTVYGHHHQIDLLINCAGCGISGAVEFAESESVQHLFQVNLFGVANLCKAAIPLMRKSERRSRIINISSVAADMPIPFQSWYSASKAALNSFTCSLANEVRPFGITVCAVMLGDARTGFTAARQKNRTGDDIYDGRITRSVAQMEHDERNGTDPQKIAEYIYKIALKKSHKPIYTVEFNYQACCFLKRILPMRLLNWIIYRVYAK